VPVTDAANPLDQARIAVWLRAQISELLEIDEDAVGLDMPFEDYGLASSDAVFLSADLSELLEMPISATLAWDHPTIAELAAFLAAVLRGEAELPEDVLDWDLDASLADPKAPDGGTGG
jgi:acyl carrier protein